MLISVIIPAYNVKQYLRQCVDSVLSQTYKNVEIIIVDDGSTDGTSELADNIVSCSMEVSSLAAQWSTKVIHKPNGGLSDARNAGLKVAKGEYVAFLDADDVWLESDGLQRMVEALNVTPTDLLLFLRVDIYSNRRNQGKVYDIPFLTSHTSEEIFRHLVTIERFDMSACFQLIRREFLLNNNLFFEVGLLSEDVDWSLRLWQCNPSVQALNIPMYGYQHREGSITTTYSIKNLQSYDVMFQKWCDVLDKSDKNTNFAISLGAYLANLYVSCLYAYRFIAKVEKALAKEILKKHVGLLDYANSAKSHRAKKILKLSNFHVMLLFCQAYSTIKNVLKRII